MNILDCFGEQRVSQPSRAGMQVSEATQKFLTHLKQVKNTSYTARYGAHHEFEKTEKYAKNLIKSAEKGDSRKALKSAEKMYSHSNKLFPMIENCFNRQAMSVVKNDRSEITDIFLHHKFSLQ